MWYVSLIAAMAPPAEACRIVRVYPDGSRIESVSRSSVSRDGASISASASSSSSSRRGPDRTTAHREIETRSENGRCVRIIREPGEPR